MLFSESITSALVFGDQEINMLLTNLQNSAGTGSRELWLPVEIDTEINLSGG